jgi:hypothetical protein
MNDTGDMILPEGFEAPAATTESGNGPAEPKAGFSMGGDGGPGNTTTQSGGAAETPAAPEGAPGTWDAPGTGDAQEAKAGDQTAKPPAGPKETLFKVKYNHEERELGYDEAVPLIQKGMNYDKLQGQLSSLQNDPRLGKYDRVMEAARLLGYQSDDALANDMMNTYYSNIAAKEGLTVEQVRKDAEQARREADLGKRETALNQKERDEAQAAAREGDRNAMYERFLTAFPGVKASDIRPETWDRVNSGMDLVAAFIAQRTQDVMAENATLKQNIQNMKNQRSAPVGSVTAHGSADPAAMDPFLMGFDSIR